MIVSWKHLLWFCSLSIVSCCISTLFLRSIEFYFNALCTLSLTIRSKLSLSILKCVNFSLSESLSSFMTRYDCLISWSYSFNSTFASFAFCNSMRSLFTSWEGAEAFGTALWFTGFIACCYIFIIFYFNRYSCFTFCWWRALSFYCAKAAYYCLYI